MVGLPNVGKSTLFNALLKILVLELKYDFILSEKTPTFKSGMKRILSEDQRTTAFRPWKSIVDAEGNS